MSIAGLYTTDKSHGCYGIYSPNSLPIAKYERTHEKVAGNNPLNLPTRELGISSLKRQMPLVLSHLWFSVPQLQM